MQQIVGQLIFGGDPDLQVNQLSPWVDMRLQPKAEKLAMLEAQTHRRFLKTHLPLDALVFSPQARYINVGRDGRDVVWSLHNHHAGMRASFRDTINNLPGGDGPPMEPPPADVHAFWREWWDGAYDDRNVPPSAPFFWHHVRIWWAARALPNVLLVHYAKLKQDLPGEIRRVAAFLEIPIQEERWDAILECCTFDWMKENSTKTAPGAGDPFVEGGQTFFHRGVNGRWSETLTAGEVADYEARAVQELGPACARWLATGEQP